MVLHVTYVANIYGYPFVVNIPAQSGSSLECELYSDATMVSAVGGVFSGLLDEIAKGRKCSFSVVDRKWFLLNGKITCVALK